MMSHELITCMRGYCTIQLRNSWVWHLTLQKNKSFLLIMLVIICVVTFPLEYKNVKSRSLCAAVKSSAAWLAKFISVL